MSQSTPSEAAVQRFIGHFFSLLDSTNESDDAELHLSLAQRSALALALPQWAHALSTACQTNDSAPAPSDATAGEDSYMNGDMGDRWFAQSPFALTPAPWANPRDAHGTTRRGATLPPLPKDMRVGITPDTPTRWRLLRHLQPRCTPQKGEERGERHSSTVKDFVDNLLVVIKSCSDEKSGNVERMAFINAIEAFAQTVANTTSDKSPDKTSSSSFVASQPPVSLLVEALFNEWCSAAVGDDSFASHHVPLHVVESDLSDFSSHFHRPVSACAGDGLPFRAVIGTLAGLACAHPMRVEEAAQRFTNKRKPKKGKRRRKGGNDEDSSDDDMDSADYDEVQMLWGMENIKNTPTKRSRSIAEQEEDIVDAGGGGEDVFGEDDKKVALASFVQEHTATFRVPLASVVLSLYRVTRSRDGTEGTIAMARPEFQFRGGEMEWHSVGESKRHRRLLESMN